MTSLPDDLRYCGRLFRRAPATVLFSVLSLGLGIGATTAVFSFVNAVQFAPLPVTDEATLVDLSETSMTELCAGCAVGTSYPAFLDWRSRATSFASMDGYSEDRFVVSGGTVPSGSRARWYLPVLSDTRGPARARPRPVARRRAFLFDACRRDQRHASASTLRCGRRGSGHDPQGQRIDREIVGVMPPRFAFPEYAQFWLPLAPAAQAWDRTNRSLGVVGACAQVLRSSRRARKWQRLALLSLRAPRDKHWSLVVAPLRDDMTGETAMASVVLLAAVGFVLLIACANVANLLLVRASDRRRELAIRTALGAGAGRIVRLVLTESLALAVTGGLIGLILALWASDAIVAALGTDAPYWITFGIDARVLLFGLAITMATGIACGLVPAFQSTRPDLHVTLRDGGAAVGAARGQRLRSLLAAGQLALALVLLAGAGLLIKTTIRIFQFEAGYDASRVLVGDVHLSATRYDDAKQILIFSNGVIENLERIPGVRAAVDRTVFFRGFGANAQTVTVDGRGPVPEEASPSFYHAVSSGYFRALGLPIREGRDFSPADSDAAIVNQEMSRRLWGSAGALGARIRFGTDRAAPWLTVIGVVGSNGGGPMGGRAERPTAYVPFAAALGRDLTITVGSDRDPVLLATEVRSAVAALDPNQPVEDVMTMEQAFARWSAPARFVALMMGSLAGVALLMAAMGTFGVVAFAVSRRTREIGVRLALGATPRQVQRQMAAAGARLATGGLLVGLPAAWASTRTLEGILAGTSPTDPVVFGTVTVVLAAVTFLASWLPARRAARVDPVVALRAE